MDPITLSVIQNGLQQVCNEMDLSRIRRSVRTGEAGARALRRGLSRAKPWGGPAALQGKGWT